MAWDYIIVGAGSAGCVLAHRLSANPKNKVLLLEGGGNDTSPVVRIPAGEIKAILSPKFNWMYMSEPDPSLNGRDAMWPGGKVLGGSSSINGMIYLRGQHEDYDDWARLVGNTGAWSYPRRAALLQAHGDQPARPERVSRRQRPARRLGRADAASAGPRLLRGRQGARLPLQSGRQRRASGRHRTQPGVDSASGGATAPRAPSFGR